MTLRLYIFLLLCGTCQFGHCSSAFLEYPEFRSWLRENKVKEMCVVTKDSQADVDNYGFRGFRCNASHFLQDGSILREREFGFSVRGLLIQDIISYNDFLILISNMRLDNSVDSIRQVKKNSFQYKTVEYNLSYEFTSTGELMYLFSDYPGEWWSKGMVYSLNKDVAYNYDTNIKRTCIYGPQGYGIEFFPYGDTTELRESKIWNERSVDGVLTNFKYQWVHDYEDFGPRDMEYSIISSFEEITYNYIDFQMFRSQIDPRAYFKEVPDMYDLYSKTLIKQLAYIDSCVKNNDWEPDSVIVTQQVRSDTSKERYVEDMWLSFHFSRDNYDSTLFLGSSKSMKAMSRRYSTDQTKVLAKEFILFCTQPTYDLRLQNTYGYNDQMQLIFHETFNHEREKEYRINFNYLNGVYVGDEYLSRCIPSETFSDDEKWMKKNYCLPRKITEIERKYSRIEKKLNELKNEGAEIIFTYYE